MSKAKSRTAPVATVAVEQAQAAASEAVQDTKLTQAAAQMGAFKAALVDAAKAETAGSVGLIEAIRAAVEQWFALGARVTLSDKGSPTLTPTVKAWFEDSLVTGWAAARRVLPSGIVLDNDLAAVWRAGADLAKSAGKGKERTELVRYLSPFIARVAQRMAALDPATDAEMKQRQAAAKKQKEAAQQKSAGAPEAEAPEAPAHEVAGIRPGESREQFIAALNLMIVSVGNLADKDKLVAKEQDSFRDVFAEMIQILQG